MTIDDIIADVTVRLGEPTSEYTGREVGLATVDGWVWKKDGAPHGLRIERIGHRHVVRAFRHTLPDGRRAELILNSAPTVDEVRAVVVLGGLLPGAAERHLLEVDPWGWNIEHPASCLPDVAACPVHKVAVTELPTQRAPFTGVISRIEVALNGDRLQILDPVDNGINDPTRSARGAWAAEEVRS